MNLCREALDKRRTLLKRRADLTEELDRSLAIQELWPRAFDHGPVSGKMSGSIHGPADFWFIIKNGLGEERAFPFWTIPLVLIDYHLARLLQTIDPRRHGANTAERICRMRRELDNAGRM
jgi:hypothetical protein